MTVGDLDVERGGLRLRAEITKNRKAGFQPLPKSIVERLAEVCKGKAATERILYVPSHAARDLDKDLKAAGIPKRAFGGKLDFHACRVAYVTHVIESGVTVKGAQELARHSTPMLTMNVYGRAREDRLAEAVEKVGEALLLGQNHAAIMPALAAGAEGQVVTLLPDNALQHAGKVRAAGLEPAAYGLKGRCSTY